MNSLDKWYEMQEEKEDEKTMKKRKWTSKDLTQKLKNKTISTYRKFGDDKAVLLKGRKSYTGHEIADEIENETEFGVKMLNNLLALTIDFISRDKINAEP